MQMIIYIETLAEVLPHSPREGVPSSFQLLSEHNKEAGEIYYYVHVLYFLLTIHFGNNSRSFARLELWKVLLENIAFHRIDPILDTINTKKLVIVGEVDKLAQSVGFLK